MWSPRPILHLHGGSLAHRRQMQGSRGGHWMPMQPWPPLYHIMTMRVTAGVSASARVLYERLKMDVWWHTPFSLWKNSQCQSLLWIIHDTARRQPVANYTRVRTWRKCAWLVGQRPLWGHVPGQHFRYSPVLWLSRSSSFRCVAQYTAQLG